eukprot:Phypoly_transcript_01288.p1 GENE.Phypoly_transcript_01288~~Phypoly_transcript_01288.p1  ORF type:complete len:1072 (+),score=298.27 Phypoly_transcript_01288:159-3374(+)
MNYDPQVEAFLSSVEGIDPRNVTTSQKLASLLGHPEIPVRENALMFFTAAICQGHPQNKEKAKDEGLIPLFFELINNPPGPNQLKFGSYICQSLCFPEGNKDIIRQVNGISILLKTLKETKETNPEVAANCMTALMSLASHAANADAIAEPGNIKLLLANLSADTRQEFQSKALNLLLNLTGGKLAQTSYREADAFPVFAEFLKTSNVIQNREIVLKILYNLTASEPNRHAIRTAVLDALLQQLLLPLPQSESIVMLSLRILGNLAFDKIPDDFKQKDDWFAALVRILNCDNQNCVSQALANIQNLLTDELSADQLYKIGSLESIYGIGLKYKSQLPILQKVCLILAEMLVLDECQIAFVEFMGLDFLIPLLDETDLEIQKSVLRAIAHLASTYDVVRRVLWSKGCIQKLAGFLLNCRDREVLRRACLAMINVSLNFADHEEELIKSGVLAKLLSLLVDPKERDFAMLASKILINLTLNDKIRKALSDQGAILATFQLFSHPEDEFKLQAAKLFTNLAISGANRKVMADKGMVAALEKIHDDFKGHGAVKLQIMIALQNCQFPYEEKYDDLNFGVEDKMPELPPDDAADLKEREEFKRQEQQRAEDLAAANALMEQRQAIEEEKRKMEQEQKEEDERQIAELERLKIAEAAKAKAASEAEEQKRREEEARKKEEDDRRRDAMQKKMMKKIALMEEEVKKREEEIAKRQEEEAQKQAEREAKEAEEAKVAAAEKAKREEEIKKNDKRAKIVNEILQVEKNYCRVLNLIISKYLNPLQTSSKSARPILTPEKIRSIFSIVEVVYNYHHLLFEGLESRIKRWLADQMKNTLCIGDIFIRMADNLKCYSTYVNNYNTAMSTLSESSKNNPTFAQFLKRVQADPDLHFEDLESFLIAPIQQLPRYIMLLTDLQRNTLSTHEDFANLTQAVERIKALTIYVNEQKRMAEDLATLQAKQAIIKGKGCPNLAVQHRKFIREGLLNFGENNSIKTKEGYVFLFNDIIVITEKTTNKSGTEYHYKDQVQLQLFRLEDDTRPGKNSFFLKGIKNYILEAHTPTEKNTWIEAIKKVMSNVSKK